MRITIKNAIAVFVATIYFSTSAYYCHLVLVREIQPVLSSWLVIMVAVLLAFVTYWRSKKSKRDLLANAMNTTDVVSVIAILGCMLVVGDELRLGFSAFDIGCFVGVGAILFLYSLYRNEEAANLAANVLLVVAYLPLCLRLATAKENTESFLIWSLWFVAASAGLYSARREKNMLATWYAGRAVVSTAIVLTLMARLEFFA